MKNSFSQTILIRTDAGPEIGSGHLMRCLALAQACLERKVQPVMVLSGTSREAAGNPMLHGMDIQFVDARSGSPEDCLQTSRLAVRHQAAWVVVDGYQFAEIYYRSLKQRGLSILCIDDCAQLPWYHADMILNQNLHAREADYRNRSPYSRTLLGSRYILLRNEFLQQERPDRTIPDQARKVLVTMGGGDPGNATLKALEWVSGCNLSNLVVDVVLGPSNPHFQSIRGYLEQVPYVYRIHRSAGNMANLMARADLAIAASGTTSLELAFMGVPAVLVAIAENQIPVGEMLHTNGAAHYLGQQGMIDRGPAESVLARLVYSPDWRQVMIRAGRQLIDGKGRERVLDEMTGDRVALRPANETDCRMIWDWANDQAVREASFSSETIPWETHVKWFQSKLHDAGYEIYIAHNEAGEQLGQVRFELGQDDAVISVSLAPSCRNRGYGRRIIALGTQKILERGRVNQVRALVKKNNIASIRAFERALFEKQEAGGCFESEAFCLVYRKQGKQSYAYHH